MAGGLAYRILDSSAGIDVVSVNTFGGDFGDPMAAWIKVGNSVVVQVVAPERRAAWDEATEERFKEAVRSLAATHPLLERRGQVSVLFDPPDISQDDGTSSIGELIRRQVNSLDDRANGLLIPPKCSYNHGAPPQNVIRHVLN